ncbi:hypothetical protein LQL77_30990 [Rhodococcus cerastii]|nr:hypothetical protein [Rhodococcus cerastii]
MTDLIPLTPTRSKRLISAIPLSATLIAALTCQFIYFRQSLIDDAYISLSYARNFGIHFQWALVQSMTSNTATSALNVIVTGSITFLVRDPIVACGIVYVLSGTTITMAFREVFHTLKLPKSGGIVAAALIMVNPLMMSTIGMESIMIVALLSIAILSSLRSRPTTFGFIAALLVLTRPDTILLVLPLAMSMRSLRTQWKLPLAVFIGICGIWYAISWLWLGSAIPDTFLIKAVQHSWDGDTFATGILLYLDRNPLMTTLAALPPAGGLLLLIATCTVFGRRRPELRVFVSTAVGGILIFMAYAFIGVPPYHWYYIPTAATLSLFAIAFIYTSGSKMRTIGAASVLAFAAVSCILVVTRPDPSVPPITSNWTSAEQYRELSRDLHGIIGTESVELDGEIGTIAYYCDCQAMNIFSDRGLLNVRIQEQQTQIPESIRSVFEANWYLRDWTQQPRPTKYRLASSIEPPRPGYIRSWRVTSQWIGERYYALYLIPTSMNLASE